MEVEMYLGTGNQAVIDSVWTDKKLPNMAKAGKVGTHGLTKKS